MFNFFRYKGTYCSQEVAIKVLKPDPVNEEMLREFSQEVYIMRLASCLLLASVVPNRSLMRINRY